MAIERVQVIPFACGIGDLVRHDPLLRAIRERHLDARIALYCPGNSGVLKYHPCVDETFSIWCSRCDYIYNCSLTGINTLDTITEHVGTGRFKELVGWRSDKTGTCQDVIDSYLELTIAGKSIDQVMAARRSSRVNLSEWLCKFCGVVTPDAKVRFHVEESLDDIARDYMGQFTKPTVVVHTKSQGRLTVRHVDGTEHRLSEGVKDWDVGNFIRFIRAIEDEYEPILIAANKDDEDAEAIVEATGCQLCTFPFHQNMALIKHADYFVGVDSGPSHVAMAYDTPALVIYCELFVNFCYPVRPAVKHEFVYKDVLTVQNVTVDDVIYSFRQLVKNNVGEKNS